MAWFQLHSNFRDHPKTVKLARALKIKPVEARGYLVQLWCWTIDAAPDGDLSSYDPESIEIAVGWDGEVGLFFEKCTTVGLIDVENSEEIASYKLHDWDEYTTSYKEAERKRSYRRKKAENGKLSRDIDGTVPGLSRTNADADSERTDRPTEKTDREERPNERTERSERVTRSANADTDDAPVRDKWVDRVKEIREVYYDCYRDFCSQHGQQFPGERKWLSKGKNYQSVVAALQAGFDLEDLKLACRGLFLSPHHTGQNGDGQWLGVQYAMRQSNVEDFIGYAQNGVPKKKYLSKREEAAARTYDDFVNGPDPFEELAPRKGIRLINGS